ncbi:unnamed protein product [Prorocentrum cordatum]|uniref:ClpA/ClpB AAA lid domain-containing protein n=1 Tax=Prorocentrum cordatum TaxID=2364126 RepID=A0ABN9ULI2_9DINO|nr:unnamed protein product [Polarella glacialis]
MHLLLPSHLPLSPSPPPPGWPLLCIPPFHHRSRSAPLPPSPPPLLAAGGQDEEDDEPPALERFGRDLVAAAAEGKLDPVLGRDKEVDRVLRVLARRNKPNVCLLGQPGVGKTAVVEEVARRNRVLCFCYMLCGAQGRVPSQLKGCKKLVQLSLGSLVGGTRYRGEFEQRMQSLLKEIPEKLQLVGSRSANEQAREAGSARARGVERKAPADASRAPFLGTGHRHPAKTHPHPNTKGSATTSSMVSILGDLEVFACSLGETEKGGSMDAANLLKPALARGELRCIGATTTAEYKKVVQGRDKAFERRFVVVELDEPSEEIAEQMLEGLLPAFERHHDITVQRETLRAAVYNSRMLRGRFLPDRALDILGPLFMMPQPWRPWSAPAQRPTGGPCARQNILDVQRRRRRCQDGGLTLRQRLENWLRPRSRL